jgi:NADH-quinone oxidoreductase subunit L
MATPLLLVLLLPLAGVLFGLAAGRRLPERVVGTVASAVVGGAFLAALVAVVGMRAAGSEGVRVVLFEWISAGAVRIDAALWLDALSAVMILTVSGVAFLIHVYSIGYMHGNEGYGRFFTQLNLFTFAMLLLVLADSLPLLFIGWEGVGLCSYLLIGFWFQKDSAADAGQKAFIVNRIGDAAFLVALLLLFTTFGTLDIRTILYQAPAVLGSGSGLAVLITLLLFAGATGKSAQLPLHVWLPDAMEGPTPVSALIHAATMVTAGVYLVARMSPLYLLAPLTLNLVAAVGATTALMAGTIAVAQTDIKRVLAYSTVSQLGYMFLALGTGAFAVGIFHLVTHAFFKALLFLGAGSVIHALGDRQDLREMGGLRKALPVTWLTMLAGALALAGIPLFAGFFSKDEILYEAWAGPFGNPVLWGVGALTAMLTGLYSFRLIYLTFHGTSRLPAEVHPHESPPVMTFPLAALAVLATLGGFLGLPRVLGGGAWFQEWVSGALTGEVHAAAHGEAAAGSAGFQLALMALSVGLALAGLWLARRWYLRPEPLPEVPAVRIPGLWKVLRGKYYFDEFYFLFISSPLRNASKWLYRAFDVAGIDGVVHGTGETTLWAAGRTGGLQRGHVGGYALALAAGAILILLWVIL